MARAQTATAGALHTLHHHTSGDVLSSISVEGLERAARFYAYFVDRIAKTPRRDLDP